MAKSKKLTTRQKLDQIRHPKLLALRGMKIGPIFPIREELEGMLVGKRGVPRKKTKFPFGTIGTVVSPFQTFSHTTYREKRRARNKMASHSRRCKS